MKLSALFEVFGCAFRAFDLRRAVCAAFLILLPGFAALSIPAEPMEDTSELLARLRVESRAADRLAGELRLFINSGTTDRAKIDALGLRVKARLSASRNLIKRYKEARTRVGLQEEWDLVGALAEQLAFIAKAYGRLTGVQPNPPSAAALAEARGKARTYVRKYLAGLVTYHLDCQGAADVLTAESFREAVNRSAQTIGNRVLAEFEQELTRFVDVGISMDGIRFNASNTARRIAIKHVGKLIAKFVPSSFVVNLAGEALIRWIGPKLKEALREKGNLEARTKRSIQTLERARRGLNELKNRSYVSVARLAIADAEQAVRSTMFLMGDLSHAAKRDPRAAKWMDDLVAAIKLLNATIKRTRHRFLVGNEFSQAELGVFIIGLDAWIKEVDRMRRNMQPGRRDPIVPPDARTRVLGIDRVEGDYDIYDHIFDDEPRGTLRIRGTMTEATFDFKIRYQGRLQWHWTGTLKWPGGQAGKIRQLNGPGHDQLVQRRRPESCWMKIERGSDNTWRAVWFNLGGNNFKLVPIRREIPR